MRLPRSAPPALRFNFRTDNATCDRRCERPAKNLKGFRQREWMLQKVYSILRNLKACVLGGPSPALHINFLAHAAVAVAWDEEIVTLNLASKSIQFTARSMLSLRLWLAVRPSVRPSKQKSSLPSSSSSHSRERASERASRNVTFLHVVRLINRDRRRRRSFGVRSAARSSTTRPFAFVRSLGGSGLESASSSSRVDRRRRRRLSQGSI